MKTQYKQMHRRPSTRNQFFRALRVEGLENRRLLAADFGAAAGASVASMLDLVGESTAAEFSTAVDQNAAGDAAMQVDTGLLDMLASIRSRLSGNLQPASTKGELRLGSLSIELPSGEEYGLTLFKSGTFDFRLVVSNTPADDAMAGDVGTSVNSTLDAGDSDISGTLSVDASMSSSADLNPSVDVGALNTASLSEDQSAGLTTSGALGDWSSFYPEPSADAMPGMTAGSNGSIGNGSSTDIAAPMILSNMNAGSLNGGSMNSMSNASLGSGFGVSPTFGTIFPTGIFSGATSSGLNAASSNDLNSANRFDASFGTDPNLGMSGEGEMSGESSSATTGSPGADSSAASSGPGFGSSWLPANSAPTHPESMTAEELAFRSRA